MAESRPMTKDKDWRSQFLGEGFGLRPLAYAESLERDLEKEIPFGDFSEEVTDQFPLLDGRLTTPTLTWLYETGLKIRVEAELVRFANRVVRKKQWASETNRINKLLKQLHQFPPYAFEETLGQALGKKDDCKLRRTTVTFERQLRDLLRTRTLWRQYADWGTVRPEFKSRVAMVEKHLRKRHGAFLRTKEMRVAVITAVLNGVGLKRSEDAIARMLRPSRLKTTTQRGNCGL